MVSFLGGKRVALVALPLCALLLCSMHAFAAEIKILSAAAVQVPALEVAQRFERETGHKVAFDFATGGQVDERLKAGALPDVVINGSDRIAAHVKSVPAASAFVRDLGTVRIGVAARKGTPKPDLSSVEAFRSALLNAQSVAYGDPARGATTGIHFAKVIDKLGLKDALAGKSVLAANGLEVMRTVSRGDAELGITQTSEIMHIDAATYVGPLPAQLQLATTYTAWVRDSANEAARSLVEAMTQAEGREKFRSAGFE